MFVVRAEPLADYGNHTYANILPGDYASPYGNIVRRMVRTPDAVGIL